MSPSSKPFIDSTRPVAAPSVGRLALRFGVGAGLVCAAWVVFLQMSGNNAFGPKQFMGLLAVPFAAAGSQWWLRYQLAPARPGVRRAVAVGLLTVVLAAAIASGSTWGLAHAVGDSGLALARKEAVEIQRIMQQGRDKEKRNAELERQELQQAAALSIGQMTGSTFIYAVMLGLLAAIPAGLFLRK